MKKLLTAILLNFVFLTLGAVSAQTKRFEWQTELCGYEGTYDRAKYTETQIKNTRKLVEEIGMIPLFTDATVGKYEEIDDLSLCALEQEYKKKSAGLRALELVPGDYWERLRAAELKELDQVYRLKKLTIQGYTHPEILAAYGGAPKCRIEYAEPLIAGGDRLLGAWRRVNLASQKINGNPERLQRRFERESASPDRLKFARVEVMRFGWWNCANGMIDYVSADRRLDQEFRGLFQEVKTLYCDEP